MTKALLLLRTINYLAGLRNHSVLREDVLKYLVSRLSEGVMSVVWVNMRLPVQYGMHMPLCAPGDGGMSKCECVLFDRVGVLYVVKAPAHDHGVKFIPVCYAWC